MGRQMIETTKNYVETNFPGAKVRYGDSVMPETPVLIKLDGVIKTVKIENLAEIWESYPGFLKSGTDKESSEISRVEAWTHNGWQSIKRVIRHKCQKKIYRILTHTGLVDVTEEHSLLGPNIELVKPSDVSVGTRLFHSFPKFENTKNITDMEHMFVIGVFVGDGSCGTYDCPSGRKSSWAINNKDLDLLDKCQTILEKVYPDFDFVIMDTLQSSGVYKLTPRGRVTKFVTEWREMCYDGQAKKIPQIVFSTLESKTAFLEGLWASDGCRRDNLVSGCRRIDTKNQITAQWYYLLLTSMDFNVSLNTRGDKPNVFRLTWTESSFRKDPVAIKKIFVLHDSWDGYVYDLETESGTFQAGIGKMIVKNTDSVMVEFDVGDRKGQEAIDYSWVQGELAAEQCTKLFKKPNNLELEKVYCPYFLYSKKRYAAKMYEKTKAGTVDFTKIDVKGLQSERRDTCQYVRETLKNLLQMILNSDDPKPAVEFAREAAKKLRDGQVPHDKLYMSKQLASDYKTKMPHVMVRDKIKKRAPGSEPQQGDRVSFLIVRGKGLMAEKAEDPEWVREHNIKVDYDYYFEHQMKKPVCDLLEPLGLTEKTLFPLHLHPPQKFTMTDFFPLKNV
jgi:hypothetical protein